MWHGRARMLQELSLEARLSGATVLAISAAALRGREYGVLNGLLLQLRKLRPDIEASWPKDDVALLLDVDEQPVGPLRSQTGARLRDDRAERKQRVMREVFLAAATRSGLLLAIDDFEACDVANNTLITM